MSPPVHSRRSILHLGSTALVGSLAGCSLPIAGQDRGISIGDIVVRHYPSETHTVRLELERDGEIVAEELFTDLGESQKEVVRATWSPEPAAYRLYTVVEGPLADTGDELDLFVREFTSEDDRTDADECWVIDIQIGPPPNPGKVAIGLGAPGPEGFGTCSNGSTAE